MPIGIGTHSIEPSDDLYVRITRDVCNRLTRLLGREYKVSMSDHEVQCKGKPKTDNLRMYRRRASRRRERNKAKEVQV